MSEIYPRSPYSIQFLEEQAKSVKDAESMIRVDVQKRPYISYATWLKKMRNDRQLNMRKFAELIGVNHSQISRLESEKEIPLMTSVMKTVKVLDVGGYDFYELIHSTIPFDMRYHLSERYARRSRAVMDESFGEQIKTYRKDLDFSFSRLAVEVEVDRTILMRMEANEITNPKLSTFSRLVQALALSPAQTYNLADSTV